MPSYYVIISERRTWLPAEGLAILRKNCIDTTNLRWPHVLGRVCVRVGCMCAKEFECLRLCVCFCICIHLYICRLLLLFKQTHSVALLLQLFSCCFCCCCCLLLACVLSLCLFVTNKCLPETVRHNFVLRFHFTCHSSTYFFYLCMYVWLYMYMCVCVFEWLLKCLPQYYPFGKLLQIVFVLWGMEIKIIYESMRVV